MQQAIQISSKYTSRYSWNDIATFEVEHVQSVNKWNHSLVVPGPVLLCCIVFSSFLCFAEDE